MRSLTISVPSVSILSLLPRPSTAITIRTLSLAHLVRRWSSLPTLASNRRSRRTRRLPPLLPLPAPATRVLPRIRRRRTANRSSTSAQGLAHSRALNEFWRSQNLERCNVSSPENRWTTSLPRSLPLHPYHRLSKHYHRRRRRRSSHSHRLLRPTTSPRHINLLHSKNGHAVLPLTLPPPSISPSHPCPIHRQLINSQTHNPPRHRITPTPRSIPKHQASLITRRTPIPLRHSIRLHRRPRTPRSSRRPRSPEGHFKRHPTSSATPPAPVPIPSRPRPQAKARSTSLRPEPR